MSWFNSHRWSTHAVIVLLAAAVVGGLGACGFRPLYGQQGKTSVIAELAAVKVVSVRDRIGQQFHNFLLDRIHPKGEPAAPKYVLKVILTESLQTVAFRKDATATRANLLVVAAFGLRDASTGKLLFRSRSNVTTSYNIVDSDFATISAKADAQRRAARVLSDEIHTRLAIFFNQARPA